MARVLVATEARKKKVLYYQMPLNIKEQNVHLLLNTEESSD